MLIKKIEKLDFRSVMEDLGWWKYGKSRQLGSPQTQLSLALPDACGEGLAETRNHLLALRIFAFLHAVSVFSNCPFFRQK